MITEEE